MKSARTGSDRKRPRSEHRDSIARSTALATTRSSRSRSYDARHALVFPQYPWNLDAVQTVPREDELQGCSAHHLILDSMRAFPRWPVRARASSHRVRPARSTSRSRAFESILSARPQSFRYLHLQRRGESALNAPSIATNSPRACRRAKACDDSDRTRDDRSCSAAIAAATNTELQLVRTCCRCRDGRTQRLQLEGLLQMPVEVRVQRHHVVRVVREVHCFKKERSLDLNWCNTCAGLRWLALSYSTAAGLLVVLHDSGLRLSLALRSQVGRHVDLATVFRDS